MKTNLLTLIFCCSLCLGKAQIKFEKNYGGNAADAGIASLPVTGGFIIAGNTASFGAGGTDIYLLKINTHGDTLWTKTYGGENDDVATSIVQTTDNGFIITGYSNSFSGSKDVYVISTDANGNVNWSKTYGTTSDDAGMAVKEDLMGGFIIAGYTINAGEKDMYLVSLDAEGDLSWSKSYGTSNDDEANAVSITSDGGYFITGTSVSATNSDVYLLKTDAAGNKIWSENIGGTATDLGRSGQQTADGGYIITGATTGVNGNQDLYLVKTDANGAVLFSKTFSGAGNNIGNVVKQNADGSYLIAGSISNVQGNTDVCLIQTDSTGNMMWATSFGDIGNESAADVVKTANGYLVTGTTDDGSGNTDVYFIKTNADGTTSCAKKMCMLMVNTVTSTVSAVVDSELSMPSVSIYNAVASIHSGGVSNTRCYADESILSTDTLSSYLPATVNEDIATPRSVATEAIAPAIVFYPNPTTGQFNISGLAAGTKIEIFNVSGQLVFEKISNGELESIDITGEAKGLYFYRITGENVHVQSGKIVKE
ncbi:MAG: putative lipoprotein [Bacteroidetes bacterium]|nr:putative lipoprotein [Bacteroidota bacterium]